MNGREMNFQSVVFLVSVGIALSLANCRNESHAPVPSSIAGVLPLPVAASPLEVGIIPKRSGLFGPGEPIEFEVSIVNRSEQSVAICDPRWTQPRGILSFEVYDGENQEMRVHSTRYPKFGLNRESDLRLLGPGESLSGILDLLEYDTEYAFGSDEYSVLSVYFCPFDGIEEIDGRKLVIAGEVQRSLPVSIVVNYE